MKAPASYTAAQTILAATLAGLISWACLRDKATREALPPTAEVTQQTALEKLMAGNDRFTRMQVIHPDESLPRLKAVAQEQHPFAVVVCCSDSRVPPELVFDQGLGNLFVVRTAGNIIGGVETGSIEYAVEHLGARLVVVMGHENCGAVKAFVAGGTAPGHIRDIVDSLKKEQEIRQVGIRDEHRLESCVQANIVHGVHTLLAQSDIIREKVEQGGLQLVPARYDLDNGQVTLLQPAEVLAGR
ncbi:carbonic anhydrase [Paraflavisolibacter sp. H34]|uniref:carbonic anhydrase n=1 Tax=Huijunlia imazamoxiresistens TaxID=3127457 RepID=UPI003017A01F